MALIMRWGKVSIGALNQFQACRREGGAYL